MKEKNEMKQQEQLYSSSTMIIDVPGHWKDDDMVIALLLLGSSSSRLQFITGSEWGKMRDKHNDIL
jgi:hypothetical protein